MEMWENKKMCERFSDKSLTFWFYTNVSCLKNRTKYKYVIVRHCELLSHKLGVIYYKLWLKIFTFLLMNHVFLQLIFVIE